MIRPDQIKTEPKDHFWKAFGEYESEVSAKWIVRLCQQKGSWEPFTLKEIQNLYESWGYKGTFQFNNLIRSGYILEQDGKYVITEAFIKQCYKASPV